MNTEAMKIHESATIQAGFAVRRLAETLSRGFAEDVVWLPLNAYQAANLRWLLHEALKADPATNLNTGDWNGEVLYELEEQMQRARGDFLTHESNRPEDIQPLAQPLQAGK
jgi:hypothetical protein